MATQTGDARNRAAKSFIEPVLGEDVLPSCIEDAVRKRLDEEKYVEALVIAIYFETIPLDE